MIGERTLEQAIQKKLLQDPHLTSFNIQVVVVHGIVTLRGAVPNARAKLAAHQLTESTPGCASVINELAIVPPSGLADQEVANNIRVLLDRHPEVMKEAITIQVDGGLVTLSGAVATPNEYRIVEDTVRATRGVRDLHNFLIIDRDAQYADESLQLEIQSALAEAEALRNTQINVAVSGDLILLSGQVGSVRQKELATEVALGVRPWRVRNEIAIVADTHRPA